ncbi:MAG: redoxin domain-containing protein [Tumebacillaceae bacterium]
MNSWKRMLISALVGGLGCLCGYALPHLSSFIHTPSHAQVEATPAVSPLQGGLAPDFSLEDTQGQAHKLSEFRGKPVMINFWASWCGYCRKEMPDLNLANMKYKGNLQIIGINIADQDSFDDSTAFLKKYGVQYPNLFDRSGYVSEQYKVKVLPTTLLIDQKGVIVERIQGPLTLDKLGQLMHKVGI